MPKREEASSELACVFQMIAKEYLKKGIPLAADTTENVHAGRHVPRLPERSA